tara:strand:- start:1097 stop:1951 length:855 start_codon:yes stop_codon:yes gene_type:complete
MKSSKLKIGYEVSEVDYNSQEDADKIRELIGEGRLVIVKNKNPVPAKDIVSLYKKIGDVVAQSDKVVGSGVDGYQELVRVRADGLFKGDKDGELEWHSAGMNRKIGREGAEDIVAMYMNKPSESGGDTYFSDFQTAYEDFEDKDKVKDLQSEMRNYSDERSLKAKHYEKVFNDEQTYRSFKDIDGIEAHKKELKTKPLVTKHPINNKEGFYYPWVVIRGFEGLEKRKAHRTYFEIKKHVMGEKYVYRHKWDNYDICLSDQHHSLHRRDKYEGDRELWRAGIWVR